MYISVKAYRTYIQTDIFYKSCTMVYNTMHMFRVILVVK